MNAPSNISIQDLPAIVGSLPAKHQEMLLNYVEDLRQSVARQEAVASNALTPEQWAIIQERDQHFQQHPERMVNAQDRLKQHYKERGWDW